jgi:hypothetical protein
MTPGHNMEDSLNGVNGLLVQVSVVGELGLGNYLSVKFKSKVMTDIILLFNK